MSGAWAPGSQVEFDEWTHTYRWQDEIVPGVNEVLASVGLKPVFVIGTEEQKEGWAERGRAVHEACAQWDRYRTEPEEWVRGWVQAWRYWVAANHFEPICVELPMVHGIARYAGRPDVVGVSAKTGRLVVVDRKSVTTVGAVPGRPAAWVKYQLAGYAGLVRHNLKPSSPIVEEHVVTLAPNGDCRETRLDNGARRENLFLAAVAVAWAKKEMYGSF